MKTQDLIGGAWLMAKYGIDLVMPLSVQSRMGGRRKTERVDGTTTETYVEGMRPSENVGTAYRCWGFAHRQ
jgi:hypothetical protein